MARRLSTVQRAALRFAVDHRRQIRLWKDLGPRSYAHAHFLPYRSTDPKLDWRTAAALSRRGCLVLIEDEWRKWTGRVTPAGHRDLEISER